MANASRAAARALDEGAEAVLLVRSQTVWESGGR